MNDFISDPVGLIEAVGDSYVRLLALVFLGTAATVFSLNQDSSDQEKTKVTWGLLMFSSFCVFLTLLFTNVPIFTGESHSDFVSSLSAVNLIGLLIAAIGSLEIASSWHIISGIRLNPGLPILMSGSSLFVWDVSGCRLLASFLDRIPRS